MCYYFNVCNGGDGDGGGEYDCTSFSQECEDAAAVTSTPAGSNMPNSTFIKDTTIRWIVGEHALGTWRIVGNTNVVYDGYMVNNVYHTNISRLSTTTSYEGSNAVVITTWTPKTITDNILVNNSPNARTKTTVNGDLFHKCKNAPHPLCIWLREHENLVNFNELFF
jgi:hypothetical protein